MSFWKNLFEKKEKQARSLTSKKSTKKIAGKNSFKDKKSNFSLKAKDFDSEKEVENYYRIEKEKAHGFLDRIEKEKATSIIKVEQKLLDSLTNKKKELTAVHEDLNEHLKQIRHKVKEIKKDKETNAENVKLLEKLEKTIAPLEKEESKIVLLKDRLLKKEKSLVDRLDRIAQNANKAMQLSDESDSKKLINLEKEKKELIEESNGIILKEEEKALLDNKILKEINKNTILKIRALNSQLRKLNKEKVDILKKKNLLIIDEEEAKNKIVEQEKKLNVLKKKYSKVLKLKF